MLRRARRSSGELVRGEARNLPLRIGPEERILATMAQPMDATPATSSCTVRLGDLYPVGHGL